MTAPGPDDERRGEHAGEPVDYPAYPDELPPVGYPPGGGYPGPGAYPPPGYFPPGVAYPPGAPPPPGGYPPWGASYPPPGGELYPGAAPPTGTNGTALTALITAVIGVPLCFLCGIPSLVAAVLGVMAMGQTRRTGQDGYGMALAAVIVGALTFVATIGAGLVWVLLLDEAMMSR